MFYKYKIGEALTYFCINFTDKDIQIGFKTPDQFLYETLHFSYDLIPCPIQQETTVSVIGQERLDVMFKEIPNKNTRTIDSRRFITRIQKAK